MAIYCIYSVLHRTQMDSMYASRATYSESAVDGQYCTIDLQLIRNIKVY